MLQQPRLHIQGLSLPYGDPITQPATIQVNRQWIGYSRSVADQGRMIDHSKLHSPDQRQNETSPQIRYPRLQQHHSIRINVAIRMQVAFTEVTSVIQ